MSKVSVTIASYTISLKRSMKLETKVKDGLRRWRVRLPIKAETENSTAWLVSVAAVTRLTCCGS